MSEGLIMVDEAGVILAANPVSEQIFGYSKGELVGMQLELLLPQAIRKSHVNLRQGFNAHPTPRRMGMGRDLIAIRKDGLEFPVEVSLSFTRYKSQLMVMAFVSDITQRKQAQDAIKRSEEQLIVYAAELENKVQIRTEALNNTVAELEREVQIRKKAEKEIKDSLHKERELNELKSKFVSLASHEFRTPLSAILSSASLIAQYKDKHELDKIDKHIGRIKSSVMHLTNILNDFLSLGKLEEGKIEVNREELQLEPFFHEIEEEIKLTLKAGQHIEVECASALTTLRTDARILRNVLFNLISNASKYSPENKPIHLGCKLVGSQVQFSVRDEGIGIPDDDKKHIFERFFRATNAGNIQGTGLGLNIVRRYAELLGGNIAFESTYGKGSTFTLSLPNQPS